MLSFKSDGNDVNKMWIRIKNMPFFEKKNTRYFSVVISKLLGDGHLFLEALYFKRLIRCLLNVEFIFHIKNKCAVTRK